MKSVALISVALAVSQCMAEPSGPSSSADIGVSEPLPDVAIATTDAGPVAAASTFVAAGPPPFTVPTVRVPWPQQVSTILVPQGARIEGDGTGALVVLGEGRNFAYRVSTSAADSPDPLLLQSETEPPRERDDGATVWQEEGQWFFVVRHAQYTCWNPPNARHDEDDVEMMIASCLSTERSEIHDD